MDMLNLNANASAPMSLEQILGVDTDNVRLNTGRTLFPNCRALLQLVSIDQGEYEVKSEDSPFAGQMAVRLDLKFKVMQIGAGARDESNKVMTVEQTKSYLGQEYTESVLFGNDGLPDKKDPAITATPGLSKLVTLLRKMIGEEYCKLIDTQFPGNQRIPEMMKYLQDKMVGVELIHNVNPNDPNQRKSSQINLFGKFVPAVGG